MTVKELVDQGTGGIVLTCKEDLDKFLKIASKEKWHWRSGHSPYRYKPKHYIEGNDPDEVISVVVSINPRMDRKNDVLFGLGNTEKGDRSIAWFVRNFTPKKALGRDVGVGTGDDLAKALSS